MIPDESVDLEASATQPPPALTGLRCYRCQRPYAVCDCGPTIDDAPQPASHRCRDRVAFELDGWRVWSFTLAEVTTMAGGLGWSNVVTLAGYDHMRAAVRWYDDMGLVVACKVRLPTDETECFE